MSQESPGKLSEQEDQLKRDDGVLQESKVTIVHPRQPKAFLGGYRNKLTGVEYHHASAQTLPKRRPDRGMDVVSRTTQTVEVKSEAQQCVVDISTQTRDIGFHVSCRNDRLLPIRNTYITADEYHSTRLRAVIQLQSFVRRWLAYKELKRLKMEHDQLVAWQEAQKRKTVEDREEELTGHHQRWRNPKSEEDLILQYHSLETWRREEEQKIKSTLVGAERSKALRLMVETEMQLIAAIERQRSEIRKNSQEKAVKKFLDKAAAPVRWQRAADGEPIEMDTPNTIRARKLRDLYNKLKPVPVNKEERLSILTELKDTVMEYKCDLTNDIVEVIDREMFLISRVNKSHLESMRNRLTFLFLHFIKRPQFNPEVAKLLKFPQDPFKLKNRMLLCRYCNCNLPLTNFKTLAGSQCEKCAEIINRAETRDEFYCYNKILRRLRADELQLNKKAKIPFLLKVEDIKFLAEVVWASSSALSGKDDPHDLVFVRWDRWRDWSPWNCILLTREESLSHLEVQDIHQVYAQTFIDMMEQNHTRARRRFSEFAEFVQYQASQSDDALGK